MRHTKLSDQLFRCPILEIKSRLKLFLSPGQFMPQAHLEVDQKCTRHIEKQTRLQSPKCFKNSGTQKLITQNHPNTTINNFNFNQHYKPHTEQSGVNDSLKF